MHSLNVSFSAPDHPLATIAQISLDHPSDLKRSGARNRSSLPSIAPSALDRPSDLVSKESRYCCRPPPVEIAAAAIL